MQKRKQVILLQKLIEVRNITKSFGKTKPKQVLDDVSIDIKKRKILGLLGETGSGKTTLAKHIIGLYSPDSGEIFLENKKVKDLKKRKFEDCAKIQYIFQDPYSAMDEYLLVEDILLEPFNICKKYKHKNFLTPKKAMSTIGIDDYDNWRYKKIATLSGGQRQKVCIARALVPCPKLLIADESTSMLDKASTKEILEILKQLKNKNKISILLISHQINVIKKICDDIAILNNAKIIETGKTNEIINNPKKDYTKELIECMDLFSEEMEE